MLSMLRDVLLDAVTEAGGTVGLLQLRAHLDQVRVHARAHARARAVHMLTQCSRSARAVNTQWPPPPRPPLAHLAHPRPPLTHPTPRARQVALGPGSALQYISHEFGSLPSFLRRFPDDLSLRRGAHGEALVALLHTPQTPPLVRARVRVRVVGLGLGLG